jgi:hypothetical protein
VLTYATDVRACVSARTAPSAAPRGRPSLLIAGARFLLALAPPKTGCTIPAFFPHHHTCPAPAGPLHCPTYPTNPAALGASALASSVAPARQTRQLLPRVARVFGGPRFDDPSQTQAPATQPSMQRLAGRPGGMCCAARLTSLLVAAQPFARARPPGAARPRGGRRNC